MRLARRAGGDNHDGKIMGLAEYLDWAINWT